MEHHWKSEEQNWGLLYFQPKAHLAWLKPWTNKSEDHDFVANTSAVFDLEMKAPIPLPMPRATCLQVCSDFKSGFLPTPRRRNSLKLHYEVQRVAWARLGYWQPSQHSGSSCRFTPQTKRSWALLGTWQTWVSASVNMHPEFPGRTLMFMVSHPASC